MRLSSSWQDTDGSVQAAVPLPRGRVLHVQPWAPSGPSAETLGADRPCLLVASPVAPLSQQCSSAPRHPSRVAIRTTDVTLGVKRFLL